MKCSETHAWLLVTRPSAAAPAPVRRHLKACLKCRRRRRRLLRLEQQTQLLWQPGAESNAKARLLHQLDSCAATVVPAAAARSKPLSWRPWLTTVAAVLLGFGLGWLRFGSETASQPLPHPRVGPVVAAPAKEADEQLLVKFIEHNLRLAQSYDAAEQLGVLSGMESDLRADALRLARQGNASDLPLITTLFDRVVHRGLVGRSQHLPAGERAQQLASLTQQLRQSEAEVRQVVQEMPPNVADFLKPMTTTVQHAAQLLANDIESDLRGEPLPRLTVGSGNSRMLVAMLVTQSLLLAEEDDPLQRASYCGDVADQLTVALLLASSGGDSERASRLGKHLEAVVNRGVGENLNRLQASNDPRAAVLQQVIGRVNRLVSSLEKSLAAGQALEAAGYDQAKALEHELKELEKALREAGKPKGPGKPEMRGTVRSIDTKAGRLVLLAKEKGKEFEMTLSFPADVKVRGPGPQERSLLEVAPGVQIRATLRDGSTITEVRIESKPPR
jgi:hypothetical protein